MTANGRKAEQMMEQKTLWEETVDVLKAHGKTFADVRWIGSLDFRIPFEAFKDLADDYYDNGYGHPMVAYDLLIVGDDWWMERHEYDGSEWWEFKTLPMRPEEEGDVPDIINRENCIPVTLYEMRRRSR